VWQSIAFPNEDSVKTEIKKRFGSEVHDNRRVGSNTFCDLKKDNV
jgi:hypothetical protein